MAVNKRAGLAANIYAELQSASKYEQTQAGYRDIYGRIANQIAHVYERENTKGSHNVATRRIFLANGWRTTYSRQDNRYVLRTVTQAEIDHHEERPIHRDRVQEGDIMLQGNSYYEVMEIQRAKSATSDLGVPIKFILNPAFTDSSPHITRPFPIDTVRGTYEVI